MLFEWKSWLVRRDAREWFRPRLPNDCDDYDECGCGLNWVYWIRLWLLGLIVVIANGLACDCCECVRYWWGWMVSSFARHDNLSWHLICGWLFVAMHMNLLMFVRLDVHGVVSSATGTSVQLLWCIGRPGEVGGVHQEYPEICMARSKILSFRVHLSFIVKIIQLLSEHARAEFDLGAPPVFTAIFVHLVLALRNSKNIPWP